MLKNKRNDSLIQVPVLYIWLGYVNRMFLLYLVNIYLFKFDTVTLKLICSKQLNVFVQVQMIKL